MATSQLYRLPSSTSVTRKPSTGSSCSLFSSSSSSSVFCELGTSGQAMAVTAAAEGPGPGLDPSGPERAPPAGG